MTISDEMYHILSKIPAHPKDIYIQDLAKQTSSIEFSLLCSLICDAETNQYIGYTVRNLETDELYPNQDIGGMDYLHIYLTQTGKKVLAEYNAAISTAKREEQALEISKDELNEAKISNRIAKYALAISIVSLIVAIIAVIVA